jgi:bifunctional DNase/RNase
MRKRRIKKAKKLTAVQLLFIAIIAAVVLIVSVAALEVYWTTVGYVQAWPDGVLVVRDTTIVIGVNCTAIVAETSPERALAIQRGLAGEIPQRPGTHDTFAQVLKSFNITLEAVQLERFDGKFYYANAILKTKEKVLKLDLMPSDGIALALRMDAPIYIKKSLLAEAGKDICGGLP